MCRRAEMPPQAPRIDAGQNLQISLQHLPSACVFLRGRGGNRGVPLDEKKGCKAIARFYRTQGKGEL